ncbi:MAG: heavy-metal-associated domain-containing protein, partial [Ignavibacteriales bacterium]|nr:heavy-metal-associated domain-containing protein [Ignavibacteriales bacterium]
MQKEKLIIEGMTCQHCVMGLKKELTDAKVQFSNVGIGFANVEVDENIPPE